MTTVNEKERKSLISDGQETSKVLLYALATNYNPLQNSVREIGYILWILNILSERNKIVSASKHSGIRQLKRLARVEEEDGQILINFEDEIWDTSLALIGLYESNDIDQIQGIVNYLLECRTREGILQGSYEGDVWETCFASIALAKILQSGKLSNSIEREIKQGFKETSTWLISLLEQANGKVVSPHHTALVIIALQRMDSKIPSSLLQQSIDFILEAYNDLSKNASVDRIWQYSLNMIALSDMFSYKHYELNPSQIEKSIAYFHTFISILRDTFNDKDSFEGMRTEDLSLSILAIFVMIKNLVKDEKELEKVRDYIDAAIEKPPADVHFYSDEGGVWHIQIPPSTRKQVSKIVALVGFIIAIILNGSDLMELFESLIASK